MSISEENQTLQSSPGRVSSSDMRMRRTQQSKQAKKFVEVMRKYQDMQNLYKGKYKAQLERQYLIVKPGATKEELARITESDGAAVLTQQVFIRWFMDLMFIFVFRCFPWPTGHLQRSNLMR